MKSGYLLVMALLVCFLASVMPAMAAPVHFSKFSAELPEGWIAEETGSRIKFIGPENICMFFLGISEADGADAKAIASFGAREIKGTIPEAFGKNSYAFAAVLDGSLVTTKVTVRDDLCLDIISRGIAGNFVNDYNAIIESITSSDARVLKLFE